MVKFFKSNIFFFLLLTIVVFVLYAKSINFDFTYHDDNSLILEKVDFLSDVKNISNIFTTSCYYLNDFKYYRPILNLSFLVETSMFGCNSRIYHLTNIILFILTLYLMYVFLLKLNLNQAILKFIILLISVHPIFTSTVVWIPARNDTLLAIFIFLSFIFFIKYLEENNNFKNLTLYVLFWTIALFTKETSILILILYPLFVYCFDYKFSKKEIIKNVLIFIPILLIYFCFRNKSVAYTDINYYFNNVGQCFNNAICGISTYLIEFFVPHYIPMMLYKIKLTTLNIVIDISAIFLILFIFYKKMLNRKILFFSLVWFIVGLCTTFFLQEYVYLNHRLIVSIFAIVIIITTLINGLITKYEKISKYFVIVYCLFFVLIFSYSFNQQNKYVNKYTYWTNSYLDAPNYHGTLYWMSRLYLENGNSDKAKEFLEKYNDICEVPIYCSDLALIYYKEGNVDKAEELYNKSIQYGINKAQCYRNLSVIYRKRDNDINKAIKYAELAVQQDPYDNSYKQYLDKLMKLSNEKNNI